MSLCTPFQAGLEPQAREAIRAWNGVHYTYLFESIQDGRWYTGATGDLRTRVRDHLQGRVSSTSDPEERLGTGSTRPRRRPRLIYYEACLSEGDAKRRERYLKTGKGKRYLRQSSPRSNFMRLSIISMSSRAFRMGSDIRA